MDKKTQILENCEKVINGLEDGTITVSSSLLICKKIARLCDDEDAITWLDYECGGYPQTKDGKHIEDEAFDIAVIHGRGLHDDGKHVIFTDLAPELENSIDSYKLSIKSFTTDGTSVSGEKAYLAMNRLVGGVESNVANLNKGIKKSSRKLNILLNEFYNYAIKKQAEILFGNYTLSVFEMYQQRVNSYFNSLKKDTILKLKAIQRAMESEENVENYSQTLATCRKLFVEIAKHLFNEIFPNFKETKYKSFSGTEIDISGDHAINQLSAVIETLEHKSAQNTLIGSNILYLVDWISNLSDLQSKGVHHNLTREETNRIIIQTYICLANIIDLFLKSQNTSLN